MSSLVIGQQRIHTGEFEGCNCGKNQNQSLDVQSPQRTETQTKALTI